MRRWMLVAFLPLLPASVPATARAEDSPLPDVEKRVESILGKMTLEEKIDYLGGESEFYVRAIPRLDVPALKMSDGPMGLRNDGPATTMGGIGLAATWDLDLARRVGETFGDDARARGVHFLLGPGVNISRAPMAGRNFEYFGEDPFLASRFAVAFVRGVQSKGVCATVKHFAGNNQEYDRHEVDSVIDPRTLREIYLPAFEAAVREARVCAIMDSYNPLNGRHMTENDDLNNRIAKGEWGFDGVIMSDWDATYDGVAAVNGGLDLEMPSGDHLNRATLMPAVRAGKVREATLDDHVRRILRKVVQFGWLDRDQKDVSIPLYDPEGRVVALEVARAGMVLLKNDGGLLPLDRAKIRTVAVIGPGAFPARPTGGGSAEASPFHAVSFLEGISTHLGKGVKVTYDPGIPSLSEMANATEFATEESGGEPGLKAARFASRDLSGAAAEEGTDRYLDLDGDCAWSRGTSAEWRSARWTGYYVARDAGTYQIFVQGPGDESRYRLFLDDRVVLDSWKRATALAHYVTVDLPAGAHTIRLEFRRLWGSPDLRVGIVNLAAVVRREATAMAAKADAVVIAVGFDPESESEGSDRTFGLPPGQDALVRALLAANGRAIVVITSGGAVDMNSWIDRAPAVLEAWYPGQEGGTALAQLLFGEASPSGKLPVGFERRFEDSAVYRSYYPDAPEAGKVEYAEGVFLGYRHFDRSGVKPLFPFGHGLSYTKFAYGQLSVTPSSGDLREPVVVSFDVKNVGSREGTEVAQLYVGDPHAAVPRPVKELKGFARVRLKPGETRRVSIPLDRRVFSYYDIGRKDWRADSGEFAISVGASSQDLRLVGKFTLAPQ